MVKGHKENKANNYFKTTQTDCQCLATDRSATKQQLGVAGSHHEASSAGTDTCDRMTVGSVGAAAEQTASVAVVPRRTGLITVKPRPSRRASAFTRKRMAATA